MRPSPLLLACSVLAAQAPELLLAKVDRLRHPWPSFSVEVELQDGKALQRWRVLARADGDARVEGLSAKEQGRTVLLLGDQMWLLLPHAKRPVQVTPQQRLLGPASGGDLARSRFAEDYQITGSGPGEGPGAQRLDLAAKRPSTSFRTARLWVSAEGVPAKAEFALASGKLAKTVTFEAGTTPGGVRVLRAMVIEEPRGGRTTLRFSAWTPGSHDPELFRLPEAP